MDFEHPYLKILCLMNAETVRGLQWALERHTFSNRQYKLFPSTLAQVAADLSKDSLALDDIDLVLVNIDLGQPLPVENLKALAKKPGLCAFLQPTPAQLLSLGDFPHWTAVAWDGVSFEKLILRLDSIAAQNLEFIQMNEFLQGCRNWIDKNIKKPSLLEWLNPPETYRGLCLFPLDENRGFFNVGAKSSSCDLKLPMTGAHELFELRSAAGLWSMKLSSTEWQVQTQADPRNLQGGDLFDVGDYSFQIKIHPQLSDFASMARRLAIWKKTKSDIHKDNEQTVANVCKEILSSGERGELRLKSGLKSGSIFILNGFITHAITGSVSGVKALLRILAWEQPSMRFNSLSVNSINESTLHLSLQEFTRIHQQWKIAWSNVHTLSPPHSLKLKANATAFSQKTAWSNRDFKVFATVCEYPMVRDILNNCLLTDSEIVETLVVLRKQGLVEPLKV